MKLDIYLILPTNINLEWTKNLSIKKFIKVLEEK